MADKKVKTAAAVGGNLPDDDGLPTDAELAQCVEILSRVKAAQVTHPRCAALLKTGTKVFQKKIIADKFGSEDASVKSYLARLHDHKTIIRKLEKLQAEIANQHEVMINEASACGINEDRTRRLAKIEARCNRTLTGFYDGNDEDPDEAAPLMLTEGAAEPTTDANAGAGAGAADSAGGNGEAVPVSEEEIAEAAFDASLAKAAEIPLGSFRRHCGACRLAYSKLHHFYHQLCMDCANLNYAKREQTANMKGMVAVVTGGRVRIGYRIVLKLLRAGAYVLTTSRFPADCLKRFTEEEDYAEWSERLEVAGPLELSDIRLVEKFCDELMARFPRIHVLINNAAQTLTRPRAWTARSDRLEYDANISLPTEARSKLLLPNQLVPKSLTDGANATGVSGAGGGSEVVSGGTGGDVPLDSFDAYEIDEDCDINNADEPPRPQTKRQRENSPTDTNRAGVHHTSVALPPPRVELTAQEEKDFPEGKLDESMQPLDLSGVNSWSRRLGQVSTSELLHTMAANAVAPFVMCGRLQPVLSPPSYDRERDEGELQMGHIINVSALEGKFTVPKKGSGHPHTNMAKAALNMLTLTSASALFKEGILINCVDTGWVTDMAPGGVGAKAATHATHVATPLDEDDGAARVLDPVFLHINDHKWMQRGKFWKDYHATPW